MSLAPAHQIIFVIETRADLEWGYYVVRSEYVDVATPMTGRAFGLEEYARRLAGRG